MNLIQITPFLHVADLDAALAFFTDTLGFTVPYRLHDYAYLQRETVGLRVMQSDCAGRLERRFTYYIDVRDVDALFAELKPKLDALPTGDVFGPVDQPYGQREFMVLGPDGGLVVFGQAIAHAERAGKDAAGALGSKKA